jgi:hypothetical protein
VSSRVTASAVICAVLTAAVAALREISLIDVIISSVAAGMLATFVGPAR